MTFSIRTCLFVMAVMAVWLGALVSKSPLMVELVTSFSVLLIVVTLPFAIWDRQPEQRAYWTGFFVLGFGNLVLSSYWGGYQRTGYQLAQLVVGAPPAQTAGPYPPGYPGTYYPPAISTVPGFSPSPAISPPATTEEDADTAPSVRFYQPAAMPQVVYTTTSPYAPQMPASQEYYQQQAAIQGAVPTMLSLLVASIGGWLTVWVWRRSVEEAKSFSASSPSPRPSPRSTEERV
jgi:hypothetical protein